MKWRLILIPFLALSGLPASAITDQYRTGILVHARPSQAEGKNCVMLTVLLENLVFVAQQCAALPWNQFIPAEFTERERPEGKNPEEGSAADSRRPGRILA